MAGRGQTPDSRVVDEVIALAGRCAGGERPADAGPDTPLVADGFWLDSLALLELLVACEHSFGVQLDQETLDPAHLRTVADLAGLVGAHLQDAPPEF